jgi:hypothetical protein
MVDESGGPQEHRGEAHGFPKCIDLILKKSKLKILEREHKEPLLMPLNGGFTGRG